MRTKRSWLVFCGVGLALAVLTVRLGLGEEAAPSEPDLRVIATVNGDAITYHDIKLSVESFSRFELEKKRTPETAADLEEARRTRHASEAKQLKAHIVVAIRRQVQKEQQVVVSEEEVSAHIQELIDNPDPSSTPQAIRAKYEPLLAALEAVYEHSEDPHDVYQRMLTNRMPREMWELNLQYYKTPERRQMLAKRTEQTELIITDSLRDGVRQGLMMRKTQEAVVDPSRFPPV